MAFMNCPTCQDQKLEPHHRAGIEVDVCPRCRGVWLDRGELDRFIADAEPAPFLERPDLEDRKPYDPSRQSDSEIREPRPGTVNDDRHDDDDDDDDDDDEDYKRKSKSKSKSKSESRSKSKKDYDKKRKSKKRKSWGEILGDALEEVLD